MDYLQQTNEDLDERIRELEDGKTAAVIESERLREEVKRLHDELRSIDRLAQQLEQEKQVGASCVTSLGKNFEQNRTEKSISYDSI